MTKEKRKLAENQASAKVTNIKTSVQKLGLVADVIRGMKANHAVLQLQFMKKKVAITVKKCLESALANAENNHELDIDNLVVDRVLVGKAFVMKRFRARARGRGAKILKPYSNIEIIVKEIEG
ncbi:MAG: 50S ribosomal protein L22 [Rickettsiales bacterium]|jgi:large subunit ribosomal protein L22|nr:50S ribosomal protein L22 [Rickettsiales bacterium]